MDQAAEEAIRRRIVDALGLTEPLVAPTARRQRNYRFELPAKLIPTAPKT